MEKGLQQVAGHRQCPAQNQSGQQPGQPDGADDIPLGAVLPPAQQNLPNLPGGNGHAARVKIPQQENKHQQNQQGKAQYSAFFRFHKPSLLQLFQKIRLPAVFIGHGVYIQNKVSQRQGLLVEILGNAPDLTGFNCLEVCQ